MGTNHSIVYKKVLDFAIEIIEIYNDLVQNKKEYVLSKQLVRSGTSIGANIAEANGGISKADFSAKMCIAYKEALESKYWLILLFKAKFIHEGTYSALINDVEELAKILYSIVRTTRFKTVP